MKKNQTTLIAIIIIFLVNILLLFNYATNLSIIFANKYSLSEKQFSSALIENANNYIQVGIVQILAVIILFIYLFKQNKREWF